MTEEGFRRYLRPYVEKKVPFLAYWHPQGFGLIRLDEVMVPAIPKDTVNEYGSAVQKRPHTLTKVGRRKWEQNMGRLRQTWGDRLVTVEFDGNHTYIEGGFEL